MILKIELKEFINNSKYFYSIVDFNNNLVTKYQNNNLIMKEDLKINSLDMVNFLKQYITYWKNEYIDNSVIDGKYVVLIIYTDKDIIKYQFKNDYPYNYSEFIELFKNMVEVNE